MELEIVREPYLLVCVGRGGYPAVRLGGRPALDGAGDGTSITRQRDGQVRLTLPKLLQL